VVGPDGVVEPSDAVEFGSFLRALHGLAIWLWRLRLYRSAETTLLNMVWLNPDDNQGARFVLPDVRSRRRWEDRRDT
jgi:hypothetical protein